jgi:hypothetical protein
MCPGAWAESNSTTMQHEAMHALGFKHEQSRPDRDDETFIVISPGIVGKSRGNQESSGLPA